MRLLVGLGNPGPKYANNRHNIGFMAVDEIVRRHNFSPYRKRFQGEVAEGVIDGEKVLALKPQTYMNASGRAVAEAVRFYKLRPADIVVFHDELDLAPGRMRVKQGGGHAGHNGLRSIGQHIGPDYARVRLGIGHPGSKEKVTGYVLADFPSAERVWLEDLTSAIAEHVDLLLDGRDSDFMSKVAMRLKPAEPSRKAGARNRTDAKGGD